MEFLWWWWGHRAFGVFPKGSTVEKAHILFRQQFEPQRGILASSALLHPSPADPTGHGPNLGGSQSLECLAESDANLKPLFKSPSRSCLTTRRVLGSVMDVSGRQDTQWELVSEVLRETVQ